MKVNRFLADASTNLDGVFGKINNPGVGGNGDAYSSLLKFLNLGLNLILIIAGLFTLFNFIIAGFKYMTAGGDSKKVSEAQNKIMFTVIGLGIIVAAPVIAGAIGFVVFGRWDAILNPCIKTIDDFNSTVDPCK
ncbi:MAG TPA: hypothetical protein VK338_00570 [Candidatus Nitrosocosmicus sp.]|nr:hypothetical protein [Candidatus Nitrosocosmicus sp.]